MNDLPWPPGHRNGADITSGALVTPALRQWIRARTGIAITTQNQAPVELAARLEAERQGLDPHLYLNRLLGGILSPQTFIDAITTNESYFFRALEQMRLVVTRLIPELARRRPGRPVRILSLPCARGEEPYSLAILCEEYQLGHQDVQIVGADISATCLADARLGCFGPLAFRRTDPTTLQRWFTPKGARTYQLDPAILSRVNLRKVNMLEDNGAVLDGPFDILFCENLLIYFDPETTVRALDVLARLLSQDGWLFVDHAEWNIPRTRFHMQELGGCVGFRPRDRVTEPRPALASTTAPSRTPRPAVPQPAPWPPSPAPIDARRSPDSARRAAPIYRASPIPPRVSNRSRAIPPSPVSSTIDDSVANAQTHYQAKRFAQALLEFDAVLAQRPRDTRARLGKAKVLADCGEDFEALEMAESLIHGADEGEIRLAPGDYVDALAMMALLLHKKGLTELARGHLRELQRRDPGHPSLALLGTGGRRD